MFDILTVGNRYCHELSLKRLAIHETCCIMCGIVMGIFIPEQYRRVIGTGGMALFLATFIPLVLFLISCCVKEDQEE